MSIFKRKDKPPHFWQDPWDKGLNQLINDLERYSQEEYHKINNFLEILAIEGYSTNIMFLNESLEEFINYIEKTEERLNKEISLETNPSKITLLFKKLNLIEEIKKTIDFYINLSKSKKYNLPLINLQQTTLQQFISILSNRRKYLEDIFIKK